MRIGKVVGRVTLSSVAAGLQGARWLVVSPEGPDQWSGPGEGAMGAEPSLVVYDSLGAHLGSRIGYVEGREASAPFENPVPVDAINAAIIDRVFHQPAR